MKKIASFLLALSLVLVGTGCSKATSVGVIGSADGPTSVVVANNPSAIAEEPPQKVFEIGMYQHVDHSSLQTIREAFEARLTELGYAEKVAIEFQSAQGDASLLNTISQKYVGDKKDLIVAIATPTAQSAAAATTEIPVLFVAVADPVSAKLVEDMEAAPTGNITGTSHTIPITDIFDMAKKLSPDVKSYGLLYNAGETNALSTIEQAKAFLEEAGIPYTESIVSNPSEVQQAAQALVGKVDAIFVPNDNSVASVMPLLSQVATENNMPLYVSADSMVMDGGLATIGVDFAALGRTSAEMAAKLIDGTPVSELTPVKFSDFATMVNTQTAEKLGLDPGVIENAVLVP